MGKVRFINWSPSEWLAGTRGIGMDEAAVYITVLNIIYDRGGSCPNDPEWIAGQFGTSRSERNRPHNVLKRTTAALAVLIDLGKLRVRDDGELTNGRADIELGKATGRIDDATRAGVASGQARRHRRGTVAASSRHAGGTQAQPQSRHINGLSRTPVPIKNQEPRISSHRDTSTDPAREGELAGPARPAHDTGGEPMTIRRMPVPPGKAVGKPDIADVEATIRDLGVDPASVPPPPPPPDGAASGKTVPNEADRPARAPTSAERLAEKAAAARRKFMGGR